MFASGRRFRFLALVLLVAACTDQAEQAGPLAPDVQATWSAGTPAFDQEVGAAYAAQAAFTEELLRRPGVVGTAVGLGPLGGPVLLVLVEDASVAVPGSLGGVGVRPLVTGAIHALQEANPRAGGRPARVDRTARFTRPVPIGVSTGHPKITAGTIGARVVDGSGKVYALSNNHVYALENQARIGDAVLQPGAYDGGISPADDVGTLAAFRAIDFSGGDNAFDAAIALSSTGLLGFSTGSDGYGVPRSQTVAAALNMPVQKCGRTTGCTSGSVAGINATVNVNYGPSGTARFTKQIIITPGTFSAGGDSGSLIVGKAKGKNTADARKPVALLFAGSATATIASPIDPILTEFGVTIDVDN